LRKISFEEFDESDEIDYVFDPSKIIDLSIEKIRNSK
jgi:hypothetical protein